MFPIYWFKEYSEKDLHSLPVYTPRIQDLVIRYQLDQKLRNKKGNLVLSDRRFRDGLVSLDLLDRIPESVFNPVSSQVWIDLGSRDFAYAWALWVFSESRNLQTTQIQGIELTGEKYLSDGSTQAVRAKYGFSKLLETSRIQWAYLSERIQDRPRIADAVSWLFPFITLSAHQKWGLRKKDFDPASAIHSICAEFWIVTHFGLEEAQLFEQIMARIQPAMKKNFQHTVTGSLHPSDVPIVICVWKKTTK